MDLCNTPKLFHVGQLFDWPIIPDTVAEDKHINGMLGFWLSPFPECCAGLGPICYSVKLKEVRRDLIYPLSLLYAAHQRDEDINYYLELRNNWRAACDVVWISDRSRRPGEIIVINLDIIDRLRIVRTEYNGEKLV